MDYKELTRDSVAAIVEESNNYIQINKWMFRLNLNGNTLLVFAAIHSFCRDGSSVYSGSIGYLSETLNVSRNTIIKALKDLTSTKLIIKIDNFEGKLSLPRYKTNKEVIIDKLIGSAETARVQKMHTPYAETDIDGSAETEHHNNTSDKNSCKNKYILSENENLNNEGLVPTLQDQEETPPPVAVAPPTEDLSFDRFWRIYDKKVGKAKAISQFAKLKLSDITEMFNVLLSYIESRPDKQYRPDPERFLRNRVWEDEIILPNTKQQSNGGISKASSSEIISAPQGYVYDPTSHF